MRIKLKNIANKMADKFISDEVNYKKYKIIEKILDDENCFLKMDMEVAYSILRDLEFPEENIKNIYKNLIDINNIKTKELDS